MSYTLEDLSPSNPILNIKGNELEISVVKLKHDVIFLEEYGGTTKLFEAIKKDAMKVYDMIWTLLLDKSRFKYNKSNFINTVMGWGIKDSSSECYKKLIDAIYKAQPKAKTKTDQTMAKINRIKNEGTDIPKPCYLDYYDRVAKRYSY